VRLQGVETNGKFFKGQEFDTKVNSGIKLTPEFSLEINIMT